ncbi:hypothetical protein Lal_00033908 [Lupinus albus]|nr:hypothetical protein Lal_00033908 [Lupinus albus]
MIKGLYDGKGHGGESRLFVVGEREQRRRKDSVCHGKKGRERRSELRRQNLWREKERSLYKRTSFSATERKGEKGGRNCVGRIYGGRKKEACISVQASVPRKERERKEAGIASAEFMEGERKKLVQAYKLQYKVQPRCNQVTRYQSSYHMEAPKSPQEHDRTLTEHKREGDMSQNNYFQDQQPSPHIYYSFYPQYSLRTFKKAMYTISNQQCSLKSARIVLGSAVEGPLFKTISGVVVLVNGVNVMHVIYDF